MFINQSFNNNFNTYHKAQHHNNNRFGQHSQMTSFASKNQQSNSIMDLMEKFNQFETQDMGFQQHNPIEMFIQQMMQIMMQLMGIGNQQQNNHRPGDKTINKALDSLGLNNTGGVESDLEAITDMYEQNGNKPIFPAPQGGDKVLNKMLKSLGLENTGSIQGDLEAIKDKYEENDNKPISQQGSKPQGGGPPWASLMDSLGIQSTGSQEGDAANVTSFLESRNPKHASSISLKFQTLGLNVSTPFNFS